MIQVTTKIAVPKQKSTVLRREVIRARGDVVKIKVPKGAKIKFYMNEDGDQVSFLHFARPIGQGVETRWFNFFVHGEENLSSLRGTDIVADVEVHSKTYTDGRNFFHANLLPLAKGVEVTKRFALVESANVEKYEGDGKSVVIVLPGESNGAIILGEYYAPTVRSAVTER